MSLFYDGYDPCIKVYANEYLNMVDVQEALHAKVTRIPFKREICKWVYVF